MADVSEFTSFAKLLAHCFSLQAMGRREEAFSLMSAFIEEARRRLDDEPLWGTWQLHEAMGFRASFAEDPLAAELEHLESSRKLHDDLTISLMEGHARVSQLYAKDGQAKLARDHARSALRFAAQIGTLPRSVMNAATNLDEVD